MVFFFFGHFQKEIRYFFFFGHFQKEFRYFFYNTIEYSGTCEHQLNELKGKNLDVNCSMLP